MLNFWVIFSLFFCAFVTVFGDGDIGPGMWHVLHIAKCEEKIHKFKFDVRQNKINRTHDGFNANFILEEPFTDEFGIRIDICKHVDGGCKPYQVLTDNIFINFINKYAENNAKAALTYAGVDPPDFPLSEGEYHVKDFVFDYTELPDNCIYGVFCAKAFILRGTEEVGCVEANVEFKEQEDEED